jgi:uncharacterized Zn-binding protein involved in type VI secretion
MPAAARITDLHTCPVHAGGPVLSGCLTVIIGYSPAARVGDKAVCAPAPDSIAMGDPTVIIGNKAAARMGDPTVHGGVIAVGCPTVIIGSSPQVIKTDKPLCEECEAKRKQLEAKAARQFAKGQ